ncbi:uncharacterized protein MONOS_15666 [Monocercomonoides exilis]|uniref:uncharacterized protein n=1 Tax=Monocercomonoides exilis TaxID=2049356 RepID=UPI0035599D08|nr:hypothetical protein MONOS_15666 [Monocercomonoides exilis]|eukprot:MONOS_15666.1-p1 / transcript=MONOS_15666.1 / gene=MONOS_15666 / organism=Monocercomonoides_exilis_PA203 / gene_product=unspecified product / transcript_product=unspecified product / location=Mono_scaffold01303:1415-2169(+) / protein_length=232 / sequence_SO=supercontig / SO=protein_coding / is_pseudo=false
MICASLSFLNKLYGFELDATDSSRSISFVKYFWAIMVNKAFVKGDKGFYFLASGHSAEYNLEILCSILPGVAVGHIIINSHTMYLLRPTIRGSEICALNDAFVDEDVLLQCSSIHSQINVHLFSLDFTQPSLATNTSISCSDSSHTNPVPVLDLASSPSSPSSAPTRYSSNNTPTSLPASTAPRLPPALYSPQPSSISTAPSATPSESSPPPSSIHRSPLLSSASLNLGKS